MALSLIRTTSSGAKLYAFELAAGTSTETIAAGVAGAKVQLDGGTLLVSAACEIQLVEETSGTALSGKFNLPQAAQWTVEPDREYRVATAGKGIRISRSASAAITGEVLISS